MIVTQLTVALVLYVNVVVAVKVPVQSDGELHTPYSPPVADVGRYPRVNPRADSPHMYDPKTLYVPAFTVAHVLSVYSICTTPTGNTNVVYDPNGATASFTVVPSAAKDAIVKVAAPAARFSPMLDVHVTTVAAAARPDVIVRVRIFIVASAAAVAVWAVPSMVHVAAAAAAHTALSEVTTTLSVATRAVPTVIWNLNAAGVSPTSRLDGAVTEVAEKAASAEPLRHASARIETKFFMTLVETH